MDVPVEREATHALGASLANRRVLLVDDHPLNRVIAQTLLEKKDIQVDVGHDGEEAVELFAASGLGLYDAVLMDIRMPGVNGLEAAKRIRALNRTDAAQVPIIAMTANAFDEDVRLSMEAGMNAHLAKPFDPGVLYGTLAKHLRKR